LYNNYIKIFIITIWNKYDKVKIIITREQSAVILNINNLLYLECTQRLILNMNKLNKIFKRIYTTEKKYKSNVRGLSYAYLIGLIEGEGWTSISKKGKYLIYEIGLEMNIRDIQLLYKIKNALGVGKIKFKVRKDINNNDITSAIYKIRSKKHLKEIIIPIFDKYPFLTNKQYDYLRFKEALLNDIKFYEDLPKYKCPQESFNSVDNILKTSYFSLWLIGFIEARGCFSIYKSKINDNDNDNDNDNNSYLASFEIAHINSFEIIQAIKIYLNISISIYKDKTNSFKIKTTNVRDIENIINFLKNNSTRLLGKKRLQYVLFLKNIKKIIRYSKVINIPNQY